MIASFWCGDSFFSGETALDVLGMLHGRACLGLWDWGEYQPKNMRFQDIF
jgi:hypothetical protein